MPSLFNLQSLAFHLQQLHYRAAHVNLPASRLKRFFMCFHVIRHHSISIASASRIIRTARNSMPWPVKRLTQRTAVVHVIARATPLQFTSVVLTESAARPALHEGHEEGVCGERARCVPNRCGFSHPRTCAGTSVVYPSAPARESSDARSSSPSASPASCTRPRT